MAETVLSFTTLKSSSPTFTPRPRFGQHFNLASKQTLSQVIENQADSRVTAQRPRSAGDPLHVAARATEGLGEEPATTIRQVKRGAGAQSLSRVGVSLGRCCGRPSRHCPTGRPRPGCAPFPQELPREGDTGLRGHGAFCRVPPALGTGSGRRGGAVQRRRPRAPRKGKLGAPACGLRTSAAWRLPGSTAAAAMARTARGRASRPGPHPGRRPPGPPGSPGPPAPRGGGPGRGAAWDAEETHPAAPSAPPLPQPPRQSPTGRALTSLTPRVAPLGRPAISHRPPPTTAARGPSPRPRRPRPRRAPPPPAAATRALASRLLSLPGPRPLSTPTLPSWLLRRPVLTGPSSRSLATRGERTRPSFPEMGTSSGQGLYRADRGRTI